MSYGRSGVACGLLGVWLLSGCGAGSDAASERSAAGDGFGSAMLELSALPSTVLCVRITATPSGQAAIVKTFAPAAGASTATLDMGRLPAGSVLIQGDAFGVACASIGTNASLYDAAPVSVTLQRGVTTTVPMAFRKNNPVAVNANFVGNFRKAAGGETVTYIATDTGIFRTGEVFGATDVSVPALWINFTDVVDMATSGGHACVVRTDGTVWCWGVGTSGQLGNGSSTSTATAVRAGTLTGVLSVSTGQSHTCATGSGGTLCWGDNTQGQLGRGTSGAGTGSTTPVLVDSPWLAVSSGPTHTIGIRNDGSLAAWGDNAFGQLGDGTTTMRTTPTSIDPAVRYLSVSAGFNHSCGVSVDGTVRCWGSNAEGQLGDGTLTASLTPKATLALGSDATSVGAGAHHTCVSLASGQVKCWGLNIKGQIGDRTANQKPSPTLTQPALSNVGLVIAGAEHNCAFEKDQDVTCWGDNAHGKLGDSTVQNRFTPTPAVLP